MVLKFEDFIKENYLDEPSNPEILDFDFKKLKKNGYIEVTVDKDTDGANKGDVVLVSSSEFGNLPDDAICTCINKDGDKLTIIKQDLIVKE